MDGWQPIDTAPKDGGNVLLVSFHNLDDYPTDIYIGFWGDLDSHGYRKTFAWCDWGEGLDDNDMWSRIEPTHWMPLPKPPST